MQLASRECAHIERSSTPLVLSALTRLRPGYARLVDAQLKIEYWAQSVTYLPAKRP